MKQKIQDESPERMLKLIRLCHPNEHGEPYFRLDVIEEFERRGIEILKALNWPIKPESVYKNRYTGGEETLAEMFGNDISAPAFIGPKLEFIDWLQNDSWSIVEHWWPVELWIPDDLLGDYKRNPTLNSFFK